MILPILAYGNPILKTRAKDIDENDPQLDDLLKNMWETMYSANGVGLAAPQIGLSISLFIIDTSPFSKEEEISEEESKDLASFKKVFINPKIIDQNGKNWDFNEGCLSIPDVREDVSRKESIKISFLKEKLKKISGNKRITIRDKKIYALVKELNLKIDFLRDDILPKEFVSVLIRQSDKNIHLNIDNGSFHYLLTKLEGYFYNFSMTSVANTNKIYSSKGSILKVKNLNNSKSNNPKHKDAIDEVFKNFQ